MRRAGRSRMVAALLLASTAALAGCGREGGYERTPPSPYAGTWQDHAGRELPDDHPSSEGFAMLSYDGARHCDAESVTFLAVAWPPGKVAASIDAPTVRQYVRDPYRAYRQVPFRGRFARDVALPPDARATGYRHGLRPVGQPGRRRPPRLRPRPRRGGTLGSPDRGDLLRLTVPGSAVR
jgi:predicted small lipoprotein YifL